MLALIDKSNLILNSWTIDVLQEYQKSLPNSLPEKIRWTSSGTRIEIVSMFMLWKKKLGCNWCIILFQRALNSDLLFIFLCKENQLPFPILPPNKSSYNRICSNTWWNTAQFHQITGSCINTRNPLKMINYPISHMLRIYVLVFFWEIFRYSNACHGSIFIVSTYVFELIETMFPFIIC